MEQIMIQEASKALRIYPRSGGTWERPVNIIGIVNGRVMSDGRYMQLDRCAYALRWGMNSLRLTAQASLAIRQYTPYQSLQLILRLQEFEDMMDMVRWINATIPESVQEGVA